MSGEAGLSDETGANVLRGCAAKWCHRTFHGEHGGALPGGPFPGTGGSSGDVRYCEHGKVWIFVRCERWTIDVWRRVYRFWEPIQYRRAVRALRPGTPSFGGDA